MLIFLDSSLCAALQAVPTPQNQTAIALDIAAEAFRRGFHVLHGEPTVLDRLAKLSQTYNQRTSAVITKARGKAPYRKALLETVKWYVRLTNSIKTPSINLSAYGNIEVCIPPSLVSENPTLFNRALVIAENLNDAHFYEGLSRSLLKSDPRYKRHFSEINLQYQAIPGGGNTTAQVYLNEKTAQEHFCLAIVDSDKTWPGSSLGATATAVQAVDAPPNTPNWNARHLVIGVRAIENGIPRKHFIDSAHEIDSRIGAFAEANIARMWGKECWEYFPHKKGMKCYDLIQQTPEGEYWRKEIGFKLCPNFSEEKCSKREACKTTAIEPLGNNLLAKLCDSKPVTLNLEIQADEFIFGFGTNLVQEMLSALCADSAAL